MKVVTMTLSRAAKVAEAALVEIGPRLALQVQICGSCE